MRGAVVTAVLRDIADLNPRLPDELRDDELVSFVPMAAVE
jgi:hypothetical protein